jgi:electron transport complex protein RnfB
VLTAVFVLAAVAALCGLLLSVAANKLRIAGDPVVDSIEALLPQTQCAQCGYAGCRPYALALAVGQADINQCPPGGETVIRALADLLNREPAPLNAAFGENKPQQTAVIREEDCIGCTLCIEACPVDAIVGSAKRMHTVLADACTGCELCLAPCPVDCIDLLPLAAHHAEPAFEDDLLARECIRCGECVPACPMNLEPQRLYAFARAGEIHKAQGRHLASCIECGRCASICPSKIPLVAYYRHAKHQLGVAERNRAQAQLSLQRFRARQKRLAGATLRRDIHLREKRERLLDADDHKRRDEISAAVARARERKASRHDSPGQS